MKVSDARAALPQNCSLHKVNKRSRSENGTSVLYGCHQRAMPNCPPSKGFGRMWKTRPKRNALGRISAPSWVLSWYRDGNRRHKQWTGNRGWGRNRHLAQVERRRYATLPKPGPQPENQHALAHHESTCDALRRNRDMPDPYSHDQNQRGHDGDHYVTSKQRKQVTPCVSKS